MKRNLYSSFLLLMALTMSACTAQRETVQYAAARTQTPITQQQVETTLQAWCDGLINISKAYAQNQDYKTIAGQVLDNLYNYSETAVSFKPTLTYGTNTFRTTREGAAAYFIGGNTKYPEDTGFALKGWTAARYVTSSMNTDGNIAIWQGNVYIMGKDGKETMVDKTFGYKRGADGKLRIILHHSSLPYAPSR